MAFSVRVASAAILYLSQVALARWMGESEYGVYVLVWTWVLVLSGFCDLGMPTAITRLLPEYLQRSEHALLRGLLHGARAAAVLAGILVAAIALILLWLVGERLNSHFPVPIYLAIACVPRCALSNVQDSIGRGRGWMAVGLMPPYILRPLLLLGGMTAAHLLGLSTQASTAARGGGRHLDRGAVADAPHRAPIPPQDRKLHPTLRLHALVHGGAAHGHHHLRRRPAEHRCAGRLRLPQCNRGRHVLRRRQDDEPYHVHQLRGGQAPSQTTFRRSRPAGTT